jgi:hypothetical protein
MHIMPTGNPFFPQLRMQASAGGPNELTITGRGFAAAFVLLCFVSAVFIFCVA